MGSTASRTARVVRHGSQPQPAAYTPSVADAGNGAVTQWSGAADHKGLPQIVSRISRRFHFGLYQWSICPNQGRPH